MTIDEFREVDLALRKFNRKLFSLASPSPPASEEQLLAVEAEAGARLPDSYRAFLKEYGGGEFGLLEVFSADRESEWYLPRQRARTSRYLPAGLLPFSDDFAGGLYVFKVEAGCAIEPVSYWNTDGGLHDTDFCNLFAFLAKHAYNCIPRAEGH